VAHLLQFRKPMDLGEVVMDHMYNVNNHVGPGKANQADDVRLVQLLLRELLQSPSVGPSSVLPTPQVTGNFDHVTALWIYYQQLKYWEEHPKAVLDGIVSPARSLSAYNRAGDSWYILMLNYTVKSANPKRFDELQNDPFIKHISTQKVLV
jgi:hypothetical protein